MLYMWLSVQPFDLGLNSLHSPGTMDIDTFELHIQIYGSLIEFFEINK